MAPSRFLLDFASKEWQASNGGKGKRSSPSGKATGGGGDSSLQHRENGCSKPSRSPVGDASLEHSGELDGPVVPISLIDTLDPEERALIVGGKVEAYWSDLTIRLKSALRSEAQAREALQDALDELDVLQDEADSARKETKRVTKEKRELEKEIHLLKKELSKAGVTPHKVGIGADPWTDMERHWAGEVAGANHELVKASKVPGNATAEKEMKSMSRSIEALERILPAISSCLLTWSNPDSPRKRRGDEGQDGRRSLEQSGRGEAPEMSHVHSTYGQSSVQESTMRRPGSDWHTQPLSPSPFLGASAHISIAAATSILASPSAMMSVTPSKHEESRIVHLVSGMYEARTASSNRSCSTPISKPAHHVPSCAISSEEMEGVDVDAVSSPEGVKFSAPADGVRLKTPRQLPFEVLGPARQQDVSRRLSKQNSQRNSPVSSVGRATPAKSNEARRTFPMFGLSMSAMDIAFDTDKVQHRVEAEQAVDANTNGTMGQEGSFPDMYAAHGRVVDANIAAHHGSRHMASSPHYELGGGHQRDMYLGDKGSPQRMSPVQKVTAALVSAVRIQSPQSPQGSPGPYMGSHGPSLSHQHSPGTFISHQNFHGSSPRPNHMPGRPHGTRTLQLPVVFASSPPPGMPIVLSAADAMKQAANTSADSVALC